MSASGKAIRVYTKATAGEVFYGLETGQGSHYLPGTSAGPAHD